MKNETISKVANQTQDSGIVIISPTPNVQIKAKTLINKIDIVKPIVLLNTLNNLLLAVLKPSAIPLNVLESNVINEGIHPQKNVIRIDENRT